jgi:hypothetical protein
MSWTHITDTIVKSARKDHRCDAARTLLDSLSIAEIEEELTPEELAEFHQRKENGFKILKGEPYLKVTGTYDGDIMTCKYNQFMYKLVERFNCFEE